MSTLEPGARRGHRQRGGHGRLPDAALARDDDDVGGGAELRNLHPGMLREQMRSPYVRVCMLAAAVVTLLVVLAASAARRVRKTATRARRREIPDSGGSMVVQVNGLIDPANAALITSSLDDAARRTRLVARVPARRSGGVDVDSARDRARRSTSRRYRSPCGSDRRVGALGARAALLALSAAYTSVAPGAHVGPLVPVDFDNPVYGGEAANDPLAHRRMSGKDALDAGVVDGNEPTLFQFIVGLDGRVLHTASGDVSMSTKKTVGVGANRQVQANGRS